MKIPTTIEVYGEKWQIKPIEDPASPLAGLCNKKELVIYLNQHQSKQDIEQTFFHECIHAIFSRVGTNQALSLETEEIICEQVATWIVDNFNLTIKSSKK